MEDNNSVAFTDLQLVLWVVCGVVGLFLIALLFDSIRRKRRHSRGPAGLRQSSTHPNIFKRTSSAFRTVREEMKKRQRRNDRRREGRK